jgi:streptogramin lyase
MIRARLLTRLLLGALLVVALSAGTATAKKPPRILGGNTIVLPWNTTSYSAAIAPDGTPWFGADAPGSLSLIAVRPSGMTVENLDPNRELVKGRSYGTTDDLAFAPNGDLWFVRRDNTGEKVVRRAPDGTETAFALPGEQPVVALTIGPEGDPWMVRGYRVTPAITHLTQTGAATNFPLAFEASPSSIVTGPDGNLWFSEEDAGKIGRISPAGAIHLFPLGPEVRPREIVAGADGRLWFSENGERVPHRKPRGRIGRITTAGKVTQFPIPFGHGTETLAADPSGPIWFSTQKGEISSISPRGAIGARGCVQKCSLVYSLAVAPGGTLWFAASKRYEPCLECGGGDAILQQIEGAPVREVPAGALASAR